MTEFYACDSLEKSLRNRLQAEVAATFGHIPFVQEHQWAKPHYAAVYLKGKAPAAFCFLVKRKVLMDGKWYWIAGLHNLLSLPAYRGKAYAQKLMRDTHHFMFHQLQADFGLLLCADALVPFYEKLGWYPAKGELYFRQADGKKRYNSNTLLLASEGMEPLQPTVIDLQGLPW